jgi:glutathione peroxidase
MSVYGFSVKNIKGETVSLELFRGQVLLIVNVASRCGFTPQYKGLQELQNRYKGKGFSVLGFPCNQFGAQEPGDEKEIEKFCSLNYQIDFPMFAKIDVNGSAAHPLYQHLKSSEPGVFGTEAIKWNFTKFLVDREGKVLCRFAPTTTPEALASEIERVLTAK